MGVNKKKSKSSNLNWKAVKLEGLLDGDDLQGFAGLEVLESYDSSLLGGKKRKRNFAISELDGDIFSTESSNKKSKTEDEHKEEIKVQKKKKSPKSVSYPGKYVLLKPPEEDVEENFFASPENSAVRAVITLSLYNLISVIMIF